MSDTTNNTWKAEALKIGKVLHEAARKHPELAPLCTSWINFSRKHRLQQQADDAVALCVLLERHGLTIMSKRDADRFQTTITSQTEKIMALEQRITTLLRPEE